MAKKVSWMWGGKRYSGTLIRETKTHKFARTHNGKIKKIVKKKVCVYFFYKHTNYLNKNIFANT